MNSLAFSIIKAAFIGLGATLTFDLWTLFLKQASKFTPSNVCLIGRWWGSMPEGTFRHSNIVLSPQKNAECTIGWIVHYLIGVGFAIVFVVFAGRSRLQHPKLIPAILFGIVTTAAPFFIMQPSFGQGIAASRAPNPISARLRSLINHTVFGIGLYLFGLLICYFMRP